MELTTRIFVFIMIVALGLSVGAALGKAHFHSGASQQETAAFAEEEEDDYLPAQFTSLRSQVPFTLGVNLFGEFDL